MRAALLTALLFTAGCQYAEPAAEPASPVIEKHALSTRRLVEVVVLNDGTRCAVASYDTGGISIDCDWPRR